MGLLSQVYANFDMTDLREFFHTEAKEKGWSLFNYLFIRKAINIAFDLGANEREGCSKLLQLCTHEFGF